MDQNDPTASDLRQIIHDLHEHQVKLELQNEELRQLQLEVEASRDRYASLYDLAPVGYLTLDETGLIMEANATGAAMLGVKRRDLLRSSFSKFIVRADEDSFYLFLQQLIDTEAPQVYEIRLIRKDSSHFYARLDAMTIQDPGRDVLVFRIAMSDITEHRQVEAALQESNHRLEQVLIGLKETQEIIVQQERLAAVGQLAAGVAHDFNNILTAMLGFAELLHMSPNMPESGRANLAHILASGQRAASLVRQLLDFSRKSIHRPQLLDLEPFIRESVKSLERIIPENFRINLRIAPNTYLVEADSAQLQQVLTNLAINARDALPSGGTIYMSLTRLELAGDVRCADCHQAVEGDWVRVTVADTGIGIAPDILPYIFEPFFTTKEAGQGSGLGLAQVLGIIKQHGSHITVDTQEGRGTTFNIYLLPKTSGQDMVEATEVIPELPG